MNKFFYESIVLFIGLLMLLSCSPSKNESAEKKDTLVNEVNTAEQDSLDDFNNQDNGDPGVGTFPYDSLSSEIKEFLSLLNTSQIQKVIEPGKDFILLTPDQDEGVILKFGNSPEDLLAIKEFSLFLLDSVSAEPFYRTLGNRCVIINSSLNGIYLVNADYERFTAFIIDSAFPEIASRMESYKNSVNDKSGYEFLFKFKTSSGTPLYINIVTIKKDGKLFITAVDQRDCLW